MKYSFPTIKEGIIDISIVGYLIGTKLLRYVFKDIDSFGMQVIEVYWPKLIYLEIKISV